MKIIKFVIIVTDSPTGGGRNSRMPNMKVSKYAGKETLSADVVRLRQRIAELENAYAALKMTAEKLRLDCDSRTAETVYLREELAEVRAYGDIIGDSPALQASLTRLTSRPHPDKDACIVPEKRNPVKIGSGPAAVTPEHRKVPEFSASRNNATDAAGAREGRWRWGSQKTFPGSDSPRPGGFGGAG